MGKYRSNVFYGNSVKRKQKMEDKKFTQGITPENFLEPRTWTFAGYSWQTSDSQVPKTAPFQEKKSRT